MTGNTVKATKPYCREGMTLQPATFETARLMVRRMDFTRDREGFITLRRDARVMKFIGIPLMPDYDVAAAEADRKQANGDFKFFYALTLKSPIPEQAADDQMIGLLIMRPMEDGETIETGYWLHPDHWGQGLVSEATVAACQLCPPAMGFPQTDLSAMVTVGHHASRTVLEKVGLRVTHTAAMELPIGGTENIWHFRWAG